MEKEKIVAYFKKNLKKGYTLDSLKIALLRQGYSKVLVNSASDRANKDLAKEAPLFKEKPKIKYEIIDENDKPVNIKKSWWKKILK